MFRFWKVFYYGGSNPYISMTFSKFFEMVMKHNPEMIDNSHFRISDGIIGYKPTTYQGKKDRLRSFAIEWQQRTGSGDFDMSYEDLLNWQAFFHYYGKKYGLLTEFKENGIC